ncbi:MAG: dienelactone hydrolase family protein [Salinivirgaceae bacterium]|nr:dienelactone hydrolase family protein [Salinivirgaceae bacterium]
MLQKLLFLISGLFLFGCNSSIKEKTKNTIMAGSQVSKTISSEFKLDYLLYLPENYNESDTTGFPLILFLHGSGERGNDIQKVKQWGPPKIAEKKGLPFIVISPQCPEGEWWTSQLFQLKTLLDRTIGSLNIDTTRIYLTGLSMGGFGTFAMAQIYPDYFAAIAPICGGGTPSLLKFSKNIPAWVFHGEIDPVVPLSSSQMMVDAMNANGAEVKFTIYKGVDHFSWIPAYNESELFEWFLSHKKEHIK